MFSITSKKTITANKLFSVVISSIRTFISLCRTSCFVLLKCNVVVFLPRNIRQVIGIASTVNKLEIVTNQMNSCINLDSPRALNDATDNFQWNNIKIFPIGLMRQFLFKYRN